MKSATCSGTMHTFLISLSFFCELSSELSWYKQFLAGTRSLQSSYSLFNGTWCRLVFIYFESFIHYRPTLFNNQNNIQVNMSFLTHSPRFSTPSTSRPMFLQAVTNYSLSIFSVKSRQIFLNFPCSKFSVSMRPLFLAPKQQFRNVLYRTQLKLKYAPIVVITVIE